MKTFSGYKIQVINCIKFSIIGFLGNLEYLRWFRGKRHTQKVRQPGLNLRLTSQHELHEETLLKHPQPIAIHKAELSVHYYENEEVLDPARRMRHLQTV